MTTTPIADYVERSLRAGIPLLPGEYRVERTINLGDDCQILIGGGTLGVPE